MKIEIVLRCRSIMGPAEIAIPIEAFDTEQLEKEGTISHTITGAFPMHIDYVEVRKVEG